MIDNIYIKSEASFGDEIQNFGDLKKLNFVFGVNGSGKTTISRIIANGSAYPHCAVKWRGETEIGTLVYNRDFVDENFGPSSDLKGIFTLGKESKETVTKIKEAKAELDSIVEDCRLLKMALGGDDGKGGKAGELDDLEADFTDECWKLKPRHEANLKDALVGVLNNKERFKKKLIAESKSNVADLDTLLEIEKAAETIFGTEPVRENNIDLPTSDDLLVLESTAVLSKIVVGGEDVDIAAMIKKLGNSDWVKKGVGFYEANDETCPFCQQGTPIGFGNSLNEYFDEVFETDTKAITKLVADYKTYSERLMEAYRRIVASPSSYLDVDGFTSTAKLLKEKIRSNLLLLKGKQEEPSTKVALDTLEDDLKKATEFIVAANESIESHNKTVENLGANRRMLANKVWKYFLESEIKTELEAYSTKKAGISSAIKSISSQIEAKGEEERTKKKDIQELERDTTSIQPTVDAINATLKSFGFDNFTLVQAGDGISYKLVRADGEDAKETLSEGERNFITFLYFYHLTSGSKSETGMTADRVVVFDDPVSSLDSNVLFIVSVLIKGLYDDVVKGSSYIKQIFVLTHNVYFHKEVTFDNRRSKDNAKKDETFWIVKKSDDGSILERHPINPIKSSYELLWLEVQTFDGTNHQIQNTLRRIIESYFTLLGNISPDDVISMFEGDEKLKCKSLFCWVNAGSHAMLEDLYVSEDSTTVDSYLKVFREVFNKTNNLGHYTMMMGEELGVNEAVVA